MAWWRSGQAPTRTTTRCRCVWSQQRSVVPSRRRAAPRAPLTRHPTRAPQFTVKGSAVPIGWEVKCGATTNASFATAWKDVNVFWATMAANFPCASSACQNGETAVSTVSSWTGVDFTPSFDLVTYTGSGGSATLLCAMRTNDTAVCDNTAFPDAPKTASVGCFPPDAPVRRLVAGGGGALEAVPISQIALGDSVEVRAISRITGCARAVRYEPDALAPRHSALWRRRGRTTRVAPRGTRRSAPRSTRRTSSSPPTG